MQRLLLQKRVLVVAGAGGVGKTTVTASVALAAAARGRRVLCLTVDPAKRLADRLGLDARAGAEQRIQPEVFAEAGLELSGELTLALLDTKGTFDALVTRYASSPEAARRILNNEFYQYISTQLAGTQAYMAMEKVLSVVGDPRYDLIVLDTPPTSDALDFLDAPERLIGAIDSAALGWLTQAFQRTGIFGLNVLARGVSLVLRGLSRLTGQGFLEHLAAFVGDVNELFGGFRERAERVAKAFRAPEFAYLLVATPGSEALGEAAFFSERLQRLGMRADGLIINRTRPAPREAPYPQQVVDELTRRGIPSGPEFVMRIIRAAREDAEGFERERKAIERARARGQALSQERVPLCVEIPAFPESVHDVAALVSACRHLGSLAG